MLLGAAQALNCLPVCCQAVHRVHGTIHLPDCRMTGFQSMQVSLMDESGNTRDDLFLPKGTDEADKLAEIMQQHWSDNKEMAVTVVKVRCMGWSSWEDHWH